MALTPIDAAHALQIQAGTLGRREGHSFEDRITETINKLPYPYAVSAKSDGHVFRGDPAHLLLQYVGLHLGSTVITHAVALSTGALATSEGGKQWLSINGANVSRCKSDLILKLEMRGGNEATVGVSTKQCNNKTPTNAQLYFTTARGFSNLLRANGLNVTDRAVNALRQFCGDGGFRPLDDAAVATGRKVDPRRFFWEEIDPTGRSEWEALFAQHQDFVFRLLLQKAYIDDPFVPEFVFHKTKKASAWEDTEVAIYSVDELVALSHAYQGFVTRPYSVRKGSYKDPPGVSHLAPRFGIVQMQRGGQAQHPEQLQFNLEAGYFYKI
jgi:hypothetical protein